MDFFSFFFPLSLYLWFRLLFLIIYTLICIHILSSFLTCCSIYSFAILPPSLSQQPTSLILNHSHPAALSSLTPCVRVGCHRRHGGW